ncbi:hypothetical protein AWN76_005420 [Rhodothermaceae bacterium RA]|nr:hypothetical protein AWN76_005420 [Rhodothermaceae bacterium RA]
MKLVEPTDGIPINGIDVPRELYWVVSSPAPLAGMRYPQGDFPWPSLHAAGFSYVVSLHPGSYNPAPLELLFAEQLEDLFSGDPPADVNSERAKVERAVSAVLEAWRSGHGVVVHCVGGRGRTGTVLGCVLRELGFSAAEVIDFLDRVHKTRGKSGWPEAKWQSEFVDHWKTHA